MTKPSIFLSHTYKDKSFARRLGDELRRAGANVWIDEAEIKLGDSLIRKITEGIQGCDYLGVILSPDSVASEWVKRELEIAMSLEIAGKHMLVLPLLYRECEIPIFLIDKHRADFTSPPKFVPSLNKIKERLGLPLTPTLPTVNQQTEALVHLIRSPLLQAQLRLQRLQRPQDGVSEEVSLHQRLASVQALLKRSELILSRFQLLQAYSEGQYPVSLLLGQDVLEIVQGVVKYLASYTDPDRNINVSIETTSRPKASLNQRLFEVAVANLLDNALKYSFPDTTVRVTFSQDTESVQVHFFNEGLDIAEHDRDKIFQSGFRGERATHVTGEGEGLGLYLAQQIMMSHGGTIKYRAGATPNDNEFILDWPKQYSPDAA